MAKAKSLEAALKILDPRPLDFSSGGEVAEASNPKFYTKVPEPRGPDGFKMLAPLDRIRDRLLNGTRETKLFLSGHVGSGKSTELSRLMVQKEIQDRFDVVSIVLEEHEWATLDSAQLLFRLGAALYEAHKERLAKADGWKKKLAILSERIFGPMGIQAKEGSIGLEFDLVIFKLKQDLKFSEAARKQFREYGETQRTALQDFLAALVDDIEEALTDEEKPNELLVVVDDLDKLRTVEQHADIFDTNLSVLLAPPLRILYTCPSAVRFSGNVRAEIRQNGEDLFPVRVLKKAPETWDPEAAYTDERIGFFNAVVDHRVEKGLVEPDAIRLAALYSGGVLRDFFRLLREGALLALHNDMKVLDGIAMKYAVVEERRRESIGLYTPDYEALIHIHHAGAVRTVADRRQLALARVLVSADGKGLLEAHPLLWLALGEYEERARGRGRLADVAARMSAVHADGDQASQRSLPASRA